MDSSQSSALLALSNDLANVAERVGAAVYAVEARRRVGSTGFLIRPNLLVTADHAIDDDDEIEIIGADGTVREATLVGRDPSTDIAVLRLETDATDFLALDAPGALRVGGIALALARDDDGDLAAAMGIVGMVGAPWQTWAGGAIDRYVRPDLELSPRFSGSPLVDASGALLGMNTGGLSRRHALTVPTDTLTRIVEAVLRGNGRIARGWLGVALQRVDLSASVAHAAGLASHAGLIVLNVAPQSPAETAGMLVGDILIAVGDERTKDVDDVQRILAPGSAGTTTTLRFVRGGEAHEESDRDRRSTGTRGARARSRTRPRPRARARARARTSARRARATRARAARRPRSARARRARASAGNGPRPAHRRTRRPGSARPLTRRLPGPSGRAAKGTA